MQAIALAAAGGLLFLALGASPAQAQTQAQQKLFAESVQLHYEGRWSAAFGRFTTLANQGDPDAARVALFMHRHGPLLYGTWWDAEPDDLQYWAELSSNRRGRVELALRSSGKEKRHALR